MPGIFMQKKKRHPSKYPLTKHLRTKTPQVMPLSVYQSSPPAPLSPPAKIIPALPFSPSPFSK